MNCPLCNKDLTQFDQRGDIRHYRCPDCGADVARADPVTKTPDDLDDLRKQIYEKNQ